MFETTLGSKISVSAATPATFNVAGYEALTFTKVGLVSDLGEFGREYSATNFNTVEYGGTIKNKGTYDDGNQSLTLGLDEGDAGQVLMQQALNDKGDYSFKVETEGGNVYYYRGKVMSWKVRLGGASDNITASVSIAITDNSGVGIVKDVA